MRLLPDPKPDEQSALSWERFEGGVLTAQRVRADPGSVLDWIEVGVMTRNPSLYLILSLQFSFLKMERSCPF
jgi:hypothetical protein